MHPGLSLDPLLLLDKIVNKSFSYVTYNLIYLI
jgi:hypothetical protein